jgi:hypothetical protein|tara:strand:+ start:26481 stop:26828 length:348 start_codon:yes stop_codon:yes gene_type:complete
MIWHGRRVVIFSTVIAFLSIIAGYTYFETHTIVQGPILVVETPHNGSTVEESSIEVVGTAHNIARITLNDRQIFVDQNGVFREQLLLPYGYSIITVAALDRFGRSTKKTIELVYK